MKVEQVIVVLSAQTSVLEDVGAKAAAGSLRCLAAAIEPAKTAQVDKACEKIAKAIGVEVPAQAIGTNDPLVGSAVDQLRLLHGLLAAAAAKSTVDIGNLIATLQPLADQPIATIKALLTPQSIAPKTAKPRSGRAAVAKQPRVPLDAAAIRQIADRLASANGDDQMFKAILGELGAQKLSKPEVFAIANRFLGIEPNRQYSSVKAAFQRIEERHFQDAVSSSRERAINQINH